MTARYIKFEDVVGEYAKECRVPCISFNNLICLGVRAVRALNVKNKHISFDMMCKCIVLYIKTPFGKRILKELANS